jgi:hypothetical protein
MQIVMLRTRTGLDLTIPWTYILFFDQPTLHEKRAALKRKREETNYKRNVSVKYDHPITALEAKHTLRDVLLDSNHACMHKLTHLHA